MRCICPAPGSSWLPHRRYNDLEPRPRAVPGRLRRALVLNLSVVPDFLAIGGLVLVGASRWDGATPWPFLLTVLGGLSWAIGNLCSRRARAARPFDLMMWMTVVPPLPMWATALLAEGPHRVGHSLATAFSPGAGGALVGLLYTCLPATVLASGIWTWLLSRHPASSVGPFSLLVPVVGLTTAWLALGEQPSALELLGGAGVVAGVLVASSRSRRDREPPPPEAAATDAATGAVRTPTATG